MAKEKEKEKEKGKEKEKKGKQQKEDAAQLQRRRRKQAEECGSGFKGPPPRLKERFKNEILPSLLKPKNLRIPWRFPGLQENYPEYGAG